MRCSSTSSVPIALIQVLDASVEDQISTSFRGNRRLGIRLLRIGDFDISAR